MPSFVCLTVPPIIVMQYEAGGLGCRGVAQLYGVSPWKALRALRASGAKIRPQFGVDPKRDRKVLDLRAAGLTFKEIGERMNLCTQGAHRAYWRARARGT